MTTPAQETQIAEIKTRLAAAARARARAEHDLDAATAAAAAARRQLHEEFGITTTEQATAAQAELQHQLDTALSDLRDQLDRIGG